MQSNKTSKKTTKIAEEPRITAPDTSNVAEPMGNPCASTSSKQKKNETKETMSAKHHRKANAPVLSGTPSAESPSPNTMAATAGAGSKPSQSASSSRPTREDIAKLAHSFWSERGYAHGSAEEDWLRAERELTQKY